MPVTFTGGANATPPAGTIVETADDPGNGVRQVVAIGKGSKTNAVATPDTGADLILAANPDRVVASLQNSGAVPVYLGPTSGVTTANAGFVLAVGETLVDEASVDAWYGVTASGTGEVRVTEVA